ncbi:hypothetical protein [Alteromonas sp. ASW11-130]|uniref:hypothetical protein n=1 Tax=Alteromonas sp. ASW11-130 TaxID=3015775 RepID=UPI002241C409|nr:hypothetical protein [Alteromonas sp. ASW11-130]MCW8091976.1 hypothetical protein [Alteromonas sp. ASW11-130]
MSALNSALSWIPQPLKDVVKLLWDMVLSLGFFIITFIALTGLVLFHGDTNNDIIYEISKVLLSVGLLGWLYKSYVIKNLIKEEMLSILYDPEELIKRNQIDERISVIIAAAVKRYLPGIEQKLVKELIDYLPSKEDFYYSRYHINSQISWANPDDPDCRILKIEETLRIEIQNQPKRATTYRFSIIDDDSEVYKNHPAVVTAFSSNEEPIFKENVVATLDEENNHSIVSYNDVLPVSDDGSYTIIRCTTKFVHIDRKPFISLALNRHCEKVDIDATFHGTSGRGSVCIDVEEIGAEESFSFPKGTNSGMTVHANSKRLFLKDHGYIMSFREF